MLAYLGMLKVPSLQNLSHTLVPVGCAKLILQSLLARFIVRILGPVPKTD